MCHSTASAAGQSECWSTACGEILTSWPLEMVLRGVRENPDVIPSQMYPFPLGASSGLPSNTSFRQAILCRTVPDGNRVRSMRLQQWATSPSFPMMMMMAMLIGCCMMCYGWSFAREQGKSCDTTVVPRTLCAGAEMQALSVQERHS